MFLFFYYCLVCIWSALPFAEQAVISFLYSTSDAPEHSVPKSYKVMNFLRFQQAVADKAQSVSVFQQKNFVFSHIFAIFERTNLQRVMKRLIILAIAAFSLCSIAAAQQSVVMTSQTTDTTPSSLSKKELRLERRASRTYRYGERGYFGTAQVGMLIFSPTYIAYGAKIINGYNFNQWFSLGGSIGAFYNPSLAPYEDCIYMPINLHLRATVLDRKVSPYFVLDAGALLDIYRDQPTHTLTNMIALPYIHPEMGVAIRFKKGRMLNIGAGFPFFLYGFCASVNVGFTW